MFRQGKRVATMLFLVVTMSLLFGLCIQAGVVEAHKLDDTATTVEPSNEEAFKLGDLIKDKKLVPGNTIKIGKKTYTVLDTNSTVGGKEEKGVLLIANNYADKYTPFNARKNKNYTYHQFTRWEESTAQAACIKYKEKYLSDLGNWLLPTYKTDRKLYATASTCDLKGDYAFALSYSEYLQYRVYIPALKTHWYSRHFTWWFRTHGNNNDKYSKEYLYRYDEYDKKLYITHYYDHRVDIRPAFNISYNTTVAKIDGKEGQYELTHVYNVSFNTNVGTVMSDVSVLRNHKIKRPQNPLKQGYIFDGWYKDAKLKKAWNFSKDVVKGNMTLYAKYVKDEAAVDVDSTITVGELIKQNSLVPGNTLTIGSRSYTVLDTNSTVGGTEQKGVLLISNNYGDTQVVLNGDNNNVANQEYIKWEGSTAQLSCKDYQTKYLSSLGDWLLPTYKEDEKASENNMPVNLNGDYAFALSLSEYCNYKEYIDSINISDNKHCWWLRSTELFGDESYKQFMYVYNQKMKYLESKSFNIQSDILPAFNISYNTLIKLPNTEFGKYTVSLEDNSVK